MAEVYTCSDCNTTGPWNDMKNHLEEESVSFPDGCALANTRCPNSGQWAWDHTSFHDPESNPHGHEPPTHWVRKG